MHTDTVTVNGTTRGSYSSAVEARRGAVLWVGLCLRFARRGQTFTVRHGARAWTVDRWANGSCSVLESWHGRVVKDWSSDDLRACAAAAQ